MTLHQDTITTTTTTSTYPFANSHCPPPTEKQKIHYILDDKHCLDSKSRQSLNTYEPTPSRLPSPFEEEPPAPTANEMQYIKRIHALMTLVSKQTKEIHSLREIIASYKDESVDSINENKKRRF